MTIQEIQCLIHRNFSKKKMTEKIRGKEIIKDSKKYNHDRKTPEGVNGTEPWFFGEDR